MPEPTGREIAVVEEPQLPTAVARREQVAGLIRPVAPPAEVLAAQNETRTLIATALQPGRDFDTIPGTNKPSLLKPGGERITAAMGCFPRYNIIEKEVDHDRETTYHKERWDTVKTKPSNWEELKAKGVGRNRKFDGKWVWQEKRTETGVSLGLYRYLIECELVHRGSGVVIGQGIGSCSTLESKYIDRPRDLENTVIKMAEKRAFVGAVLNAFGLSDQFTQDVEDNPEAFGIEKPAEPAPPFEPAPLPNEENQNAPGDAPAMPEQIEHLGALVQSHLIKPREREIVLQRIADGLTKLEAIDLIEDTTRVLKRRKEKEKPREPGSDDGPLFDEDAA